jgi:hypothetical protein
MSKPGKSLAESILALEEVDESGHLTTALEVLQLRKAKKAADDKTEKPMDLEPEIKIIFGRENMKYPLPNGMSLEQWGQTPCKLKKVSHFGQTYSELLKNPEAISYIKWVCDNGHVDRYSHDMHDFYKYLMWLDIGFEIKDTTKGEKNP